MYWLNLEDLNCQLRTKCLRVPYFQSLNNITTLTQPFMDGTICCLTNRVPLYIGTVFKYNPNQSFSFKCSIWFLVLKCILKHCFTGSVLFDCFIIGYQNYFMQNKEFRYMYDILWFCAMYLVTGVQHSRCVSHNCIVIEIVSCFVMNKWLS